MREEINREKIIAELDYLLSRNDYKSAKEHLLYWLSVCEGQNNQRVALLLSNELMGLFRKLSDRENALKYSQNALDIIEKLGIEENIGAATTYLNTATVYKAFSMAEKSLPLFEKALKIYEKNLSQNDERYGGLYNNMALTLVDLEEFERANELFEKAISVMREIYGKEGEVAITYLNMATAVERKMGPEEGEKEISSLIEKAWQLLDSCSDKKSGNYAFVCEKCATVFGYYGYFAYQNELKKRSEEIYERA